VRASGEPRPAESVGRRAVPRPAESVARRAGGVSGSARSLRRSPGESPESPRRFGRPLADPARSGRPPALPATSNLHQSQLKPSGPLLNSGRNNSTQRTMPAIAVRSAPTCPPPARRPSQAGITNALRAVTLR